jgi:hypothetical protein
VDLSVVPEWLKILLGVLAPLAGAYGGAIWGAAAGYKRTRKERGLERRLAWYDQTVLALFEHCDRVVHAVEVERQTGLSERALGEFDEVLRAVQDIASQVTLGKVYATPAGTIVCAALISELAHCTLLLPGAPIPGRYEKAYRHVHRIRSMADDLINEERELIELEPVERSEPSAVDEYVKRLHARADGGATAKTLRLPPNE